MSYNNYLVSNELGYQNVVLCLHKYINPGGIYIGVGADQNYTYAAVTRPSFVFIIDNRKENQLLHYLFKACFELAPSRPGYLSILFSKPLKNDVELLSLRDIVNYFSQIDGERVLFKNNWDRLYKSIQKYRISIAKKDIDIIYGIYENFFEYHLLLRTRNDLISWQGWCYPTYKDFLLATDQKGYSWNFLNNDVRFYWLKAMQRNNCIIPIVGDLTGGKTLKTIGEFAKKRGKSISTIYISNAEQFIFQSELFDQYMINITALPLDYNSLLIRAFFLIKENNYIQNLKKVR